MCLCVYEPKNWAHNLSHKVPVKHVIQIDYISLLRNSSELGHLYTWRASWCIQFLPACGVLFVYAID